MNNFFIIFYLKFMGCIVITMPKKPKPRLSDTEKTTSKHSFTDSYKP